MAMAEPLNWRDDGGVVHIGIDVRRGWYEDQFVLCGLFLRYLVAKVTAHTTCFDCIALWGRGNR